MNTSWVAFLLAKDPGSARKLLFRIQEAIGVPMELGEVETYAKDASLYRCTFTTTVAAEDSASVLYSVLVTAGRLAPGWHVNGLPPDGPLEGWTDDGIVVAGVTSLGFSVSE